MRLQFIWMAVLAAGLGTAAPADDLNERIQERERAWATATTGGDVVTLDKLFTNELIYAHSTGIIENKKEYLDRIRTAQQRYDRINQEKITVVPYGDAVVSHSILRMTGLSNGKPFDDHVMLLHLWVRQNGAWRIAAHQTTKLPH
ncbi:MAG: nuclear transport factor 2 family protein [Acidobacteriaceae bacterium]|nr:nuclear transport factor 2 family protein [Acidobacteriaceae bacterium]